MAYYGIRVYIDHIYTLSSILILMAGNATCPHLPNRCRGMSYSSKRARTTNGHPKLQAEYRQGPLQLCCERLERLMASLSRLSLPVKPEASTSGSGPSPASRRSSLEESSDEEERLSFSFPGEFEPKIFGSAAFGSPYRALSQPPVAESWWSGLTSKLYDLLGIAEAEKQLEPFQPSATAIIFDWDDTLFPTWHVIETLNDARLKSHLYGRASSERPRVGTCGDTYIGCIL